MNLRTLALISISLAASLAARAQVEIRLTGSTAFRAAAYRSLSRMFDGGNPVVVADNADPTKAGKVTLVGTMTKPAYNLGSVVVRASYSGSVAGCQAIRFDENVSFLNNAGNASFPDKAHFALLDNEPENVPFDVSVLESEPVGVVPFTWVKNPAAVAEPKLSNMTQRMAKTGLSSVFMPLAQFTGNPADTKPVFFCGRAWTSGTRIVTLAETEYGPLVKVLQAAYDPTSKTFKQATAALTGATDPYNIGYGYEKGGDLKAALTKAVADAPQYAVGMLGIGDAKGLEPQWLTYSGAGYSKAAVVNGLYSFWSYERLAWKSGVNSGSLNLWYKAFVAELSADLASDVDPQPIGISLNDMKVGRSADGGPVL